MSNKDNVENINDELECDSDDSLFNISSYGVDMSFRELITMYKEGDLLKPEMQRRFVWKKLEASRFIDSILLGLPVPSIFLAKTSDEKRLIVDGYQRIMTVYDYVERGVFGGDNRSFTLSSTKSINERWRGKAFSELQEEEKRKIKTYPIHAIVFEQKEPRDDTGMYQIFERINTSGRSLKPQEIRNCVYHGRFNQFLMELNTNDDWRKIWGGDCDSRMTDVELVLRMFAFSDLKFSDYLKKSEISLTNYLSDYMNKGKDFSDDVFESKGTYFKRNMNFLVSQLGINTFRNGRIIGNEFRYSNKINPAIMDSVYVATDFYLSKTNDVDIDIKESYCNLLNCNDYKMYVSKRTTRIDHIKQRINIATKILYGVEYEW